ncbi:MAG: hypothetical protein HY543_09930, partial [Deltaproteobacteria bacterium]|nr:hypothetical protein [Deltaproteobacteria bacterium]
DPAARRARGTWGASGTDPAHGETALVDCGLLGTATREDAATLLQIYAGFAAHGLSGATATLLRASGVSDLATLGEPGQTALLAGLAVFARQQRAGTAPELLLPGLATLVARSTGIPVRAGLGVLFRALQHLAPYLRAMGSGGSGAALPAFPTTTPAEDVSALADAIQRARADDERRRGETAAPNRIPQGIGVGRILPGGTIETMGVLQADCDPDHPETHGSLTGLLRCVLPTSTRYVWPADLRLQVEDNGGPQWITLEEWRKRQTGTL